MVGKLVRAVHPVDVLVDAVDEDVAVVGIDLDRGEDEVVVALRQPGDLFGIPEVVVLAQADTVEPRLLRALDQVVRREIGVPRERAGMRVEVDQQVSFLVGPGTRKYNERRFWC